MNYEQHENKNPIDLRLDATELRAIRDELASVLILNPATIVEPNPGVDPVNGSQSPPYSFSYKIPKQWIEEIFSAEESETFVAGEITYSQPANINPDAENGDTQGSLSVSLEYTLPPIVDGGETLTLDRYWFISGRLGEATTGTVDSEYVDSKGMRVSPNGYGFINPEEKISDDSLSLEQAVRDTYALQRPMNLEDRDMLLELADRIKRQNDLSQ